MGENTRKIGERISKNAVSACCFLISRFVSKNTNFTHILRNFFFVEVVVFHCCLLKNEICFAGLAKKKMDERMSLCTRMYSTR